MGVFDLPTCRKDANGARTRIVVSSITITLEFHHVCPPAHSSKTPVWWTDEDVEPDSTSATMLMRACEVMLKTSKPRAKLYCF